MKLAIVGGGGVRAPLFVQSALKRAARLNLSEICLMDTDAAQLQLIGALCAELARRDGGKVAITTTTSAETAFTGVSGIGASNVASGQTVAVASVSLNAQAAGSVIYAVGQDWTNGVTRTFPAGQVQDVQMVGADLDTFWVQRTAAPIAAAGAITFTATSATQAAPGDRWNFAIIELKR